MRITLVAAACLATISIALFSISGNEAESDPEREGEGVVGASNAESAGQDASARRREQILRRIADSDTYLGHALAEDDSILRRWEDRTISVLTVHVGGDVGLGVEEGLPGAVRRAFERWERVGAIPVSFRLIRDSARAEIQVHWIRSFEMNRSGLAEVFRDGGGWIRKATLTLATHNSYGSTVGPDVIYTVALHEIGHLLGLGHSDDSGDLMYPVTRVSDLTPRDRRTARLLYALPPGSLKLRPGGT